MAASDDRDPIPSSRRKTRVLALATTVPARSGDGTPEFVVNIARSLVDRFEITLLAPRVRDAQQVQEPGIEIRRFPYFPRRWEGVADGAILPNVKKDPWRIVEIPCLVIAMCWAAIRAVREQRPCLVHANWLVPAGAVALLLRWMFGLPYIVTVLGDDAYRLRSRPLRDLKALIRRKAAVVTPLSREMGLVLGFTDEEADRYTVPLGVDVEAIQADVGPRSPKPDEVLFVGRLVEKKGVDVLLRALVDVPEARLNIVGDGPDREELERLAVALGVEERVAFLGQGSVVQVRQHLARARAIVIPSRVARSGDKDGTPLVMCEAMAAGTPVVASNLGGLGEHIRSGENGVLVRPDSIEELTRALQEVLAAPDDQLESRAENAKRYMMGTLDIGTTRRKYMEFYDMALRQAPPHCRSGAI